MNYKNMFYLLISSAIMYILLAYNTKISIIIYHIYITLIYIVLLRVLLIIHFKREELKFDLRLKYKNKKTDILKEYAFQNNKLIHIINVIIITFPSFYFGYIIEGAALYILYAIFYTTIFNFISELISDTDKEII